MSAIKAFNANRDAALRSLDRRQFEKFLRKWNLPRPKQWIGDAWLAAMHKARLQLVTFTAFDKAISRAWLAQHGYTEQIVTSEPCPCCGSQGASNSGCPVCGVA